MPKPSHLLFWLHQAQRSISLFALLGAAIVTLPACTNLWKASLETMQDPLRKKMDIASLNLDPSLTYLKLSINDQESILVLGYENKDEQVWFSSDKAVFKTKNGALSGMSGFGMNWQIVQSVDPSKLPKIGLPTAYTRIRNSMPGYQFEVRESVLVSPLAQVPTLPLGIRTSPSWRWFSESVSSQYGGQKQAYLYPGLMAIDISARPYQIMYAEQCLSPDYCLRWQRLSAGDLQPVLKSK
jgi:hypothetical protein